MLSSFIYFQILLVLQIMATGQNNQSNGLLSNGSNTDQNMAAPIFSITPQLASGSNMVTAMTFNTAPDRQALPVQPPLSDFLGQVKN